MKRAIFAISSLLAVLAVMPPLADAASTNPGTFRAPTISTGAVTTKVYWTAASSTILQVCGAIVYYTAYAIQ